ncbi:MAG: hypothetical protein DMF82_12640 [Acidobacteria bacterium]|nr:MAG: hypothetical protein DMF82_12640 [Acidobacteriota bacterium]
MGRGAAALLVLAGLASAGCAAKWAYRQGQGEAKKGNWDMAVARLTKAQQKDPNNIGYKIALENARVQASRYHQDQARKALAADNIDKAAEELKIATDYDPSNKAASDQLANVKDSLLKRPRALGCRCSRPAAPPPSGCTFPTPRCRRCWRRWASWRA